MVPWRDCACVLAAAEKKTVPFPLPLAPAVTASHDAPLDADHMHPAGALTAVEPVLALAATEALPGATEYEQFGAAADWFTVNVSSPMVIVACRVCVRLLVAAENVTVPLPVPFAPPVTVNHDGALLTAVHEHPEVAVTEVDPVPPLAAIVVLPDDSVYEHDAGA